MERSELWCTITVFCIIRQYVGSTIHSMTCLLPYWRWSGTERNRVDPDDGIILLKYVGAIIKNTEVYNSVHLLVNFYISDNARYKEKKIHTKVLQDAICSESAFKTLSLLQANSSETTTFYTHRKRRESSVYIFSMKTSVRYNNCLRT
jgi:hypothetical protein